MCEPIREQHSDTHQYVTIYGPIWSSPIRRINGINGCPKPSFSSTYMHISSNIAPIIHQFGLKVTKNFTIYYYQPSFFLKSTISFKYHWIHSVLYCRGWCVPGRGRQGWGWQILPASVLHWTRNWPNGVHWLVGFFFCRGEKSSYGVFTELRRR